MEKTKAMCSFGTDEYGLQTGTMKISELNDFKGHPFKVEQDIQLFELMRSIEDKGVLVPLIVRSNPYGDGYEIIAGHRRKAACTWAGIEEVPVIIREMDDSDAVIAMIDSNLQREYIKPSEKAYAYKMKLEAMKSQGKRNDLTSSQLGTKLEKEEIAEGKYILRADERLAKEVGESRNQIARYIRLTNLIPKILDVVDAGRIAFTIGVELSYLTEEEQYELHAVMDLEQCTPSLSQANKMKRMSQAGTLDMDEMYSILEQEKPNQREQIKIRADKEIEKRIGVQTDTTAIDKELANYESKLKEVDLNKARLEREIDNLPIDARFRERKIHDMTLRLDALYDTIVELEERIEDAKLRKSSIEMETITLDNIYKLMLNFGKLYDIISDEEKKSLITYLIKEIQIYPNGESDMPLKSIEFNFPIYRDGQEVRRLLWEKGNTVETVCLLSKKCQF